ncbi:MAG: Uma2 family endonuclease [Cyanobacteria bacterium P01_A01_bin.17]
MTSTALSPTTLEHFSKLPNIEESPAWELLSGQVLQKPMPTLHYSRLQKRLIAAVDAINSAYEAFPELRCILRTNSIVPDITILHQSRIPVDNGPVQGSPDWLIEILSPDQSTTKLITKVQACLAEGTQLGWLIDSKEAIIMIFLPNQPLQLLSGDSLLPVLDGMLLQLTPDQIFAWLSPPVRER